MNCCLYTPSKPQMNNDNNCTILHGRERVKVFMEYTTLADLILCCHRLLSMQQGMYYIFSIAEVLSVKVKVKIALSFIMLLKS